MNGRFICVLFFAVSPLLTWSPTTTAQPYPPFPSFPCEYATLAVEKAICRDNEIQHLDWELDDIYRRAKIASQVPSDIRKQQMAWLSQRNGCEYRSCIMDAYRKRISELRPLADSLTLPSGAKRPSYNCRKAAASAEIAICTSEQLSALDWKISDAYQRARMARFDDRIELRDAERAWIKSRNACETYSCIVRHYDQRIPQLSSTYASAPATVSPPINTGNHTPREEAPRPTSRLTQEERQIVEKLAANAVKCLTKKAVTDQFNSPAAKAFWGAVVTTAFDGDAPPAGKVAAGYMVDKYRQILKENGHAEAAKMLGHAKTAECIMNGVVY